MKGMKSLRTLAGRCFRSLTRARSPRREIHPKHYWARQTSDERSLAGALVRGLFVYHRVGHDKRMLRLENNGSVGEGAAGLERYWCVRSSEGSPQLFVGSEEGATMVLGRDADGVWRGQWEIHERMPVELIPEGHWLREVDADAYGGRRPLSVTVHGSFASGYGRLGYEAVRGLLARDVPLYLNGRQMAPDALDAEWAELIRRPRPDDWQFIISPPNLLGGHELTRRSIVLTMWESEELLPEWVAHLNRAALVLVPSSWNQQCFQRCGVTAEIKVVLAGYDPACFRFIDRYPDVCTFGFAAALGTGGVRKNVTGLVQAFCLAFPRERDVRLRLKLTPACFLPDLTADPRIDVIRARLSDAELCDWYASLSAFVNPSYSEGWGLHLLEAMATGRPLISTRYSGVAEFFDETVGYPAEFRLIDSPFELYRGRMAEPDLLSLTRLMREVYADRSRAQQLGRTAAERAGSFSWDGMHDRLLLALHTVGALDPAFAPAQDRP